MLSSLKGAIKGISGGKAGVESANKFLGMTPTSFATQSVMFGGFTMAMEGESPGRALVTGARDTILWESIGWPLMAVYGAGAIIDAGTSMVNRTINQGRQWNQLHRPQGTTYMDTQKNLTMRQSAVQAISGSKLNARSAMGGEARLMHRSYRA